MEMLKVLILNRITSKQWQPVSIRRCFLCESERVTRSTVDYRSTNQWRQFSSSSSTSSIRIAQSDGYCSASHQVRVHCRTIIPASVGNWTFRPQCVPPGRIQRFLLIQLKPKHHRLDVLTTTVWIKKLLSAYLLDQGQGRSQGVQLHLAEPVLKWELSTPC